MCVYYEFIVSFAVVVNMEYVDAKNIVDKFEQLSITPFGSGLVELQNARVYSWFGCQQFKLSLLTVGELTRLCETATITGNDLGRVKKLRADVSVIVEGAVNKLIGDLGLDVETLGRVRAKIAENFTCCGCVDFEDVVDSAMEVADIDRFISTCSKSPVEQ